MTKKALKHIYVLITAPCTYSAVTNPKSTLRHHHSANTRRWLNAGLTLAERRRREFNDSCSQGYKPQPQTYRCMTGVTPTHLPTHPLWNPSHHQLSTGEVIRGEREVDTSRCDLTVRSPWDHTLYKHSHHGCFQELFDSLHNEQHGICVTQYRAYSGLQGILCTPQRVSRYDASSRWWASMWWRWATPMLTCCVGFALRCFPEPPRDWCQSPWWYDTNLCVQFSSFRVRFVMQNKAEQNLKDETCSFLGYYRHINWSLKLI